MGIYIRADAPKYYWLWLERPGQKGIKERTTVRADATSPQQRKDNERLAEAVYHRRMSELARAGYELPARKDTITFAEFADWYALHVSAHKRSRDREAEILKRIRADFGSTPLAEVTKARVQEWITRRREPRTVGKRRLQASAATVNRELDLLKHVLASAVPRYLAESPIAGMKRLRTDKREMRILAPADEAKILAALAPRDRAIVVVALDTLMRLGDILNLQRRHDHRRYLVVLDPKGGETYKVPVSTRVRAALDALPNDGPYYFPHRRVAKNPRDWRSSVKQMLEDACAAAQVAYGRQDGITFHMLRHTGASRMVEAGVDLRTVQQLGGWKGLRQLMRYTHPTDAAMRAAVEVVGAAVDSLTVPDLDTNVESGSKTGPS